MSDAELRRVRGQATTDPAATLAACRRAIAADPHRADIYRLAARAYRVLGEVVEAERMEIAAIEAALTDSNLAIDDLFQRQAGHSEQEHGLRTKLVWPLCAALPDKAPILRAEGRAKILGREIKRWIALLCAGLCSAAFAQAPTSAGPSQAVSAPAVATAPDAQIRTFLAALLAGKVAEGVDGLLGASAAQKQEERNNLVSQINAAVTTYGPIIGYEKVRTDTLGSMALREYYFVQHREMVVRWEFEMVRTGLGWEIDYFGFDDQPKSWF